MHHTVMNVSEDSLFSRYSCELKPHPWVLAQRKYGTRFGEEARRAVGILGQEDGSIWTPALSRMIQALSYNFYPKKDKHFSCWSMNWADLPERNPVNGQFSSLTHQEHRHLVNKSRIKLLCLGLRKGTSRQWDPMPYTKIPLLLSLKCHLNALWGFSIRAAKVCADVCNECHHFF